MHSLFITNIIPKVPLIRAQTQQRIMPITRRQAQSSLARANPRSQSPASQPSTFYIDGRKSKHRSSSITTSTFTPQTIPNHEEDPTIAKQEPTLLPSTIKHEPMLVNPSIKLRLRIKPQSDSIDIPSRKRSRIKQSLKDVKNEALEEEVNTISKRHRKRTPTQYKMKKEEDELYTPLPDIEDEPICSREIRPPTETEAREVTEILRKYYNRPLSTAGHPKTKPRKSLLDSLIATILSQATTNTNSSRAFQALKKAFPEWEQALTASPIEIEEHIRCGGLAQAKSKVIHTILKQLKEQRGECCLDYLRDMTDEEAKKEMCRFKGVGPKTASCVLMFGMQRHDFPVDTHIRRLAGRLGWMPPRSTPEKTYDILNECLPGEIKYQLHVLLIEHGRKTCKARDTRCDQCPLVERCPAYRGEFYNVKMKKEEEE